MSESSVQPRSVWVARLFKGVAAVLAILSLTSGIRSLGAVWFEYRDEQATISSSLDAAHLMAETDMFELAWQQLDYATERTNEPAVAMARYKNKPDTVILTPIMQWRLT